MRQPIVKVLVICPYCNKEFKSSSNELKILKDCEKHIRRMHPETEKDFQAIDRKAAIIPGEVKLLKAGY